MKKIITTFLITAFLAINTNIIMQAQNSFVMYASKINYPDIKNITDSAQSTGSGDAYYDNTTKERVEPKVLRAFIRSFRNVNDLKWYKQDGNCLAYFMLDGIKNRAVYSKRGNLEFLFRQYAEDDLPRDIHDLIKSVYYNYNIYWINEFSTGNKMVYIITLEDKKTWKKVMLAEGEMETIKEYLKA